MRGATPAHHRGRRRAACEGAGGGARRHAASTGRHRADGLRRAARFGYPVYHPRTFVTPGYQGTLGWGYATALGVKVARPECPVVSISGDGGFMFSVQDLATAVRHDIAVVAVVFDDGAYGNVKRAQEMR